MKTRDLILHKARLKEVITTSEIVRLTNISRQTITEHFRKLVRERKLIKFGSTHNAKYCIPSKKTLAASESISFKSDYPIKGLNEDLVFDEVSLKLNLMKLLSDNAFKIVRYAFTEMLNNAIDHSGSNKVKILVYIKNGELGFTIIDHGIGIFENIKKKFKLKNHLEAVEHLLKGKQTTDPKRHSGQGIFFTSKIADKFILKSTNTGLIFDNTVDDVIIEDVKSFKGTKVIFILKQKSRKDLGHLFNQYQDNEYEFDKTKLSINISMTGKYGEYVSRSEAKRLLFGLEKFKRIVLDFKKVKGIGQGFADEIFRVFKSDNPTIKIEAINMSPSIEFMIKRVDK